MKLIIDIEPRYCKDMRSDIKGLYYDAINRIIEAVSNGVPYEENPQGDLISRKALREGLEEMMCIDPIFYQKTVFETIDNVPTVEAYTHEQVKELVDLNKKLSEERPQGKWVTVKQDTILGTFEVKNKVCDQCNHATKYEYPFCPWCGADMRGGKE